MKFCRRKEIPNEEHSELNFVGICDQEWRFGKATRVGLNSCSLLLSASDNRNLIRRNISSFLIQEKDQTM